MMSRIGFAPVLIRVVTVTELGFGLRHDCSGRKIGLTPDSFTCNYFAVNSKMRETGLQN
jgi:hypothetical protein